MLEHTRRTTPDQPALLGGAQGKRNKAVLCALRARLFVVTSRAVPDIVGVAHPFFGFVFYSHVRRLDQARTSGGVGRALFEHVDAQRIVRVAQPRSLVSDRGNPAGAVSLGRLFFGYFLLATQKKVTCWRATPGEVDFVIHASTG